MKINMSRDQLLDAVSWAARVLPARPASPLLASLQLRAASNLSVSAFDHDASANVSVPADVTKEGAVLVPGRLLADIVRSLPAKLVELATDGTRMTLRCGTSTFTLVLAPDQAYPALPDMPPLAGTIGSAAFSTALSQVAVAASGDDSLPALTGVRIELNGNTLTLVATDRYRLAVRELPWNPALPHLPAAILVPARVLNDTARSLTSAAEVSIYLAGPDASESGGIAGFAAGGRRITTRLIAGEYPAYRDLLPDRFCAHAEIPAGPLTEAISRVNLVTDRNAPVRLSVRQDRVTVGAGADGEAQATEEVDITGSSGNPEFQAAFNPAYLLDGLGALGTDTAFISFTGPARPVVLTGKARSPMRDSHALGPQPDYRYVLMPIRPGAVKQEEQ